MASGGRRFVAAAIARLAGVHPEFSAQRVPTAGQIAFALLLVAGAAMAIHEMRTTAFLTIDIAASVFFFGVTILRFIAATLTGIRHPTRLADTRGEDLPVYTVLVPLYREERLVKQLVAALGRLQWPASHLDIKLIVEEDDLPTRRAVERAVPGAPFEVVIVPAAAPRTKPKALAYALPFARGHFVTIYDAEDRPHPGQLARGLRRLSPLRSRTRLSSGADRHRRPGRELDRPALRDRVFGAVRRPAAGAGGLEAAAAARRHLQPFPPRRPGGIRGLGSLQRHRGRRSRHPPRPLRLRIRILRLPTYEDAPNRFHGVAQAAESLVQGLDAPCQQGNFSLSIQLVRSHPDAIRVRCRNGVATRAGLLGALAGFDRWRGRSTAGPSPLADEK